MMSDRKTFEPTRRQLMAGATVALGGLAMGARPVWAGTEQEISHAAESIHQVREFKASRKRIFEALLDNQQFDKMTQLSGDTQSMAPGSPPTRISREVGGTFRIFGGHIVGRHIDLAANERIVQAWRVVDWEPGLYSIARFDLVEQGSGTKLVFDHTGFPKGDAEHLATGWNVHYWEPLEKLLA